jgi:hypothetical protein
LEGGIAKIYEELGVAKKGISIYTGILKCSGFSVASTTVNSYHYWDFQTLWDLGLYMTDIVALYTHLTLMTDHTL